MKAGIFSSHLVTAWVAVGILLIPLTALADSAPVVSNIQAVQRPNTFIVDITYDLANEPEDATWVSLYFSPDGGATWPIHCAAVTGAADTFVPPGTGHSVQWDAEADYPDFLSGNCTIRVMAVDHYPWPRIQSLWKTDLDGQNPVSLASGDTLGFAEPFRLHWQGEAPATFDMDPQMLASLDHVYPHDDGLLGYKYRLLGEIGGNCVPALEDCWNPRYFDEATGDSISYFGSITSLDFHNDGTGTDPFHQLLPSGTLQFMLNTLDVGGQEIREFLQLNELVINYDPDTIILNGQTDWAHPEDPEVYPYYFLLNDPAKVHHPFQDGDRIPDRSYVVVKALGRDDARDIRLDPEFPTGVSGYLKGTRDNLTGGLFSFQTESSTLGPAPTWSATCDTCWSADTLGFLTGPRTNFTINMQAVDEHGRKDGTPAALSFDVGYPPCLQCIEIHPKTFTPSGFDANLECLADTDPGTLEAHPCFGDTTVMRITLDGAGDEDLQFIQPAYLLVHKVTGDLLVEVDPGQGGEDYFEIQAVLYRMKILLHGLDDPRERWEDSLRRMMAWAYQIDYECDPFNRIQDGGGNDNILLPTWGTAFGSSDPEIDPDSGLWAIFVDVAVPTHLMTQGPEVYRDVILRFIVGIEDPVLRDRVFDDTTRQLGTGRVQAIALDQTQCAILPIRPARYNIFRGVRPSVEELPLGVSWRDCNLDNIVPGIMLDLDLSQGSMESLEGEPVSQYFRIILDTNTGDFECQLPGGF